MKKSSNINVVLDAWRLLFSLPMDDDGYLMQARAALFKLIQKALQMPGIYFTYYSSKSDKK